MTIYDELAARVGAPKSKVVPKIFEMIADETDVKILMALPSTIRELNDKLGLSEEELDNRLEALFIKGVVYRNKNRTPVKYRTARNPIHLHDTSIQWAEAPGAFLDLWQEWMDKEYSAVRIKRMKMQEGKKPFSRIIPASVWIEPKQNVLHFDSIKEILANARSIAVVPCTCRLRSRKCDYELNNCIVLNTSADYNIERGTGRKIDVEEALKIFKESEEAGLVHLSGSNAQDDPGPLICNCCPCCCMGIPYMQQGFLLQDPSRFCAEIDKEACSGCAICHERCYFGAISWENEEGGVSVVDPEKCLGCGLCEIKCPEEAITMKEVRPPEFVPKTATTAGPY